MCVDLLKRSKTCTLASIYISLLLLGGLTTHCHISIILLLMRLCFIKKQGAGHYVKPGPTKRDIMVDATWDAKLCTCNIMDMKKVMFKHWS